MAIISHVPIVVYGEKMEKIKIGKIVNAVALKGEVKVYNYSDSAERYTELERIICRDKEYRIENVRTQGNMVILKLESVDDRNAAEALKNRDIYITEEDLKELPEDTFYIRDLIGLAVVNEETGETIGKIADVIQGSAQDVYRIDILDGEGEKTGETMVPAVSEFVKKISLEEGRVYIRFIEGML